MAQKKTRGIGFQSAIRIYKQPDDVAAHGAAITHLTNTNPAIATVDNHTLQNGDVVYVESEHNEAVNGYYFVTVSNENTFALLDLDGTDIGTLTDAKYVAVEYFNFCDANSCSIEAMKTKSTDATTNCDDGPVTELERDPGTISIGALWAPDKTVHEYLDNCFEELEPLFVAIKIKQGSKLFGYKVAITSYKLDGQSGEKWKSSIEFTINGRKRKLDLGALKNG